MQIGIFAKTFAGINPAAGLAASKAAGFDGVQYNMACSGLEPMPGEIPAATQRAVAAAAETVGQTIFAVSGTYNMIHPDPVVRSKGHQRLEILAAACQGIGTRLITLCTGTRDADDQWRHHPDNASQMAWSDLLASFEVAVQIAERHDILLGVEPELANVVNSAQAARRLIDTLQSDRIRIVLDPANLFEVADSRTRRHLIAEAVDLLADRIVMAHAKDRDPAGGFVTAGQGVIDFGQFLANLHRAGFDGPLVTHGLSADEAAGVATFLRSHLQRAGT
ncbi:MAG: sugar phosphate isomerase/epimerase [bacterium]